MMKMKEYVARRMLLTILIVIGLTFITFTLTRSMGDDPAVIYAGKEVMKLPVEAQEPFLASIREQYHLNEPIYVQYYYFLGNLVQGDLGVSTQSDQPVTQDIIERFPATLELISYAIIIALFLGIMIGIISAKKSDTWVDHGSRLLAIAGVSLPAFWVAVLFQMIFASNLGLFPSAGRASFRLLHVYPLQSVTGFYTIDSLITGNFAVFADSLWHLVLPAVALATYPFGSIIRMTRATLLEVFEEDYIRAAKASGLPKKTISSYALKNAMGPTITIAGLNFAYSLIGAFYIELIFSWNGLGQYGGSAILTQDYGAILGVTMTLGIFYVIVNLVIDILQTWVDPRIGLGES